MGRHFARRLGARLAESPLYEDVDLIVPVPLHGFRHFRRGYNQAEIIARALAEKMGKSDRLCINLLRRTRHTKTQTQLSIEQKQRNVADAFRVSPRSLALLSHRAPATSAPSGFPRHILLVDDVFTTGSTLSQCHKALRQVFPPTVRISVATLAFVGEG
jgi:ComF family protein